MSVRALDFGTVFDQFSMPQLIVAGSAPGASFINGKSLLFYLPCLWCCETAPRRAARSAALGNPRSPLLILPGDVQGRGIDQNRGNRLVSSS